MKHLFQSPFLLFIFTLLFMRCAENETPHGSVPDTSHAHIPAGDSAPPPLSFTPDPTSGGANMEVYSASGPENITRGVLQASNGVYWFGSWNGLFSFDGTTFTNHTLKDGLSHHRVYSVYEDSKGNIWACTAGAGVYRYDGANFRNISTRDGLSSNNVFVAFEDHTGNMWFGSDSGASKYDYKTMDNLSGLIKLTGSVLAIAEDCKSHVWFGGLKGCFWFEDNGLMALKNEKGAHIPALALRNDANCTLWIAGPNGVLTYNAESHKLQKELSNSATHLSQDKAGNMLITASAEKNGSTEGMYIFRYSSSVVDTVTQRTGFSGAGAQIFGVIEDHQNHIWFGTVQGVCELDGTKTIGYYTK